ncbi:MAG: class I SAM-dependent rRNA methyltransferase [Phycisphaerae bacterium]|nr:class I SAM-dependent rRNA methyltransferase [Phycisphaerae bacterium]
MKLESLLLKAFAARQPMLQAGVTNAIRLFHGRGDGVDGLVIELFGDVLIAQFHPGHGLPAEEQLRPAIEALRQAVGARAVYRKVFVPDRAEVPIDVAASHVSSHPWLGEPVELEITVSEYNSRFMVRSYDGFSVGLFLEHRENRQRVRAMAAGRRVLNLFSYTCSFSVAAAQGGAANVASVDVSKRYLEWGKQNFAANDLSMEEHLFFCSDVLDFFERAKRQHRQYDLVILDPPTFARMRRPMRTFVLDQQIGSLIAGVLGLLDPGGILLLATNARQISMDRLEHEIRAAAEAAGRSCSIIERPPLPADFPNDPDYSKTVFVQF